jgi:hypothetical protein
MKRIGSLVAATSLFVGLAVIGASPAFATTVHVRSDDRVADFSASDCGLAATIGTHCRRFHIVSHFNIEPEVANVFTAAVDAYDDTVTGPGGASTGPVVASGFATAGTFGMPLSGKTATLKFNISLTCKLDPGCPIQGLYKFSIALRRSADSAYTLDAETHTTGSAVCETTTTVTETHMPQPGGTGTVRVGASNRPLHPRPELGGEFWHVVKDWLYVGTCS